MTCKLSWMCDGGSCRRELTPEDLTASEQAFSEWVKEKGADYRQARTANPEVFCSSCVSRAEEFWQSRTDFLSQLAIEVRTRVEKHRNRFWAAPKSQVIKMEVKRA